jgi:hypothetical protein
VTEFARLTIRRQHSKCRTASVPRERKNVRIVVANQNFDTDPTGLARRIIAFVAEAGWPPRDVTQIDPPNERMIPSAQPEAIHRLDFHVLIADSVGAGIINRTTPRDILRPITSETDPATSVTHSLAGTLAAPASHDRGHGHANRRRRRSP